MLEVTEVPLAAIKPYDGNAKLHTHEQLDAVEASIKEFGFANPVLLWTNEDGQPELIAGHARCKAAQNLGMETVPAVFLDYLSDAQRRALTLVDNQTTMMTGWDMEQLAYELETLECEFDMAGFGFEIKETLDNPYTDKVKGLIYEPAEEMPELKELCDTSERDELEETIKTADVSEEEKAFLRQACQRFVQFRYDLIADYYAGASPAMREAMEALKLVIADHGGEIEAAAVEMIEALGETYVEV